MKVTMNKKGYYLIQLEKQEKAIISGFPKDNLALLFYTTENTVQTRSILVSGLNADVDEKLRGDW